MRSALLDCPEHVPRSSACHTLKPSLHAQADFWGMRRSRQAALVTGSCCAEQWFGPGPRLCAKAFCRLSVFLKNHDEI